MAGIYEFPFEYELAGHRAATFECRVEYEATGYINRYGVFEMEDVKIHEPLVEVFTGKPGAPRNGRAWVQPDDNLRAKIKAHMATTKFQDAIAIHAADSGNFEVAA